MNKVICDICGTDYPETASQCPICGCAKADGGQTAAGNSAAEETAGYTYVRGGRFSKANVRKRLKASQLQQAAAMQSKQLEAVENNGDDDDFDEEELDNVSNKGLVLIVILLLLAIIAVGSYIAITFLGGRGDSGTDSTGQSQQTTDPQASSTQPTQPQVTGVPCTGLKLHDVEIMLENSEAPWFELYWEIEPADTTDLIEFTSADPSVATVDANGVVTAVGNGETVITVKCGQFEAQCTVVCDLDSDEPDVTEPTDEPDVPDEPVVLALNREDFTLSKKGSYHQLYSGEIDRSLISWSSDNENIATVEDGKVVAVSPGRTTIRAEYDGQEVTCIVRCGWVETTEPDDTTNTDTPDDITTEPPVEAEPVSHELLVNGAAPNYRYENKENSAEFTLTVSEDANLSQCTIKITNAESVQWSNANETVCSVDASGKVTALSDGSALLTAEVDGVTYTVMVRVNG